MKTYRLAHTDFWPGFDCAFFKWLIEKTGNRVQIVPPSNDVDILIYSVFGDEHHKYSCKKIYWTGENTRPNMSECDIALSFDFSDNPKNYRFPLYAYQRWIWAKEGDNWGKMELTLDTIFDKKDLSIDELYKQKPNFCTFIQGNSTNPFRNEFFTKLNSIKRVDSGGPLLNNIGRIIQWPDKLNFIKDYRFCISFENAKYNGYLTEKIFEPMLMKTVPIYWGSDSANIEFNEDSFINANNMTIDEIIEKVMWYENNPNEYYELWKKPYLDGETQWTDYDRLINFLTEMIL